MDESRTLDSGRWTLDYFIVSMYDPARWEPWS